MPGRHREISRQSTVRIVDVERDSNPIPSEYSITAALTCPVSFHRNKNVDYQISSDFSFVNISPRFEFYLRQRSTFRILFLSTNVRNIGNILVIAESGLCPIAGILKNITFRKLYLLPSSGQSSKDQ
jgi:hypothetical protein